MHQGTIYVIPQSHIDVAWLWRYDPETIHRCCKPTFTLATDNMDRYPDYTFSQSQVPLYTAIEEAYPELFAKIKQYIEEGRWEIVGGMYVEFEGGEPCGESIVRQCVMGKRYFQRKFGVEVKTGWQMDAWSHPWQLPQILKKSGIHSYMFKRGEKGQRLFWWQSPDGSRVLAYKPLHGDPSPSWKEFLCNQSARYGVKDVMILIGSGDHGGGPRAEEIEKVRRFAEEVSPDIKVRFSTFRHFTETLLAQKSDYPVLNDELGFELVGDLTNCGEIKKNNRQCENLLLTAEKCSSIVYMYECLPYPQAELEEAWKKLLFNQFHDIIGGSGIPPVCKDAHRSYEIVKESGEKVLQNSLSIISKHVATQGEGTPIIVMNPLSWKRSGLVETELAFEEDPQGIQLQDGNGEEVPVQILRKWERDGKHRLRFIFIAEDVPSLGYGTYYAVKNPEKAGTTNPLSATEEEIENAFFGVKVDPDSGCLKSIFDKRNLREVLDGSKRGNLLVALEDDGDSEGRFEIGNDVVAKLTGKSWNIVSEPSIKLCEAGPVRAKIRIKKPFQNSLFTQDVMLYSKLRRIDFDLTIDWHDTHRMIKVAFPLCLREPEVTYNVPYGSIVRPADGLEYPAQKWVDLSSSGYGVSLLNNARYAHDVEGNILRMSILRSPTKPAYNTDEGIHSLRYSIYPHSGSWKEAGVMRRGYELNIPLMPVVKTSHEGELPDTFSFMKIEPDNLILEAVKREFDSEYLILRFYEIHGKNCMAFLTFSKDVESAYETDLLENDLREVKVQGKVLEVPVGAYEIKTLRVRISSGQEDK